MPLNVLAIGGSRNIGYFSSLRLLDAGASVTFLLRSPTIFDGDEAVQKYIKSGNARLVKGDALVKQDVQHAWDEAGKDHPVDVLLFTVGGVPKFSLTKGALISPHNLVTECLFNALTTLPSPTIRIIALTSTGLSPSSHSHLPFLMKPFYGHFLAQPHRDKLGVERLISYCTGWEWDSEKDGEPGEDVMGANWTSREGLPAPGSLHSVLIVRPALLTDSECQADKPGKKGAPYRVADHDFSSWIVSRKDVAHFVTEAILTRWNEFENKCIRIGY